MFFCDKEKPPKVIDYACGAGHFLTEMASQLRRLRSGQDVRKFYSQFYGIEKEYRLSKVAKVSAFMYNQDEINIVYADALVRHSDIREGEFALLVSNPPYSVKGFLETLPESERKRYKLTEIVDPRSYPTNDAIETFFLERARQLLAPRGLAGIIVPSSLLSNTASIYVRTREILLQNFDIIALVELGSGTFGKTGTNTVTLFLRRKDDNPGPADHYCNRVKARFDGDASKDHVFDDDNLLEAYCKHTGIAVNDYRTLLQSNPNGTLLDTEIFREYRRTFDASREVKALKKQKSFLEKSEDEQQADLDRRFIQHVRKIEREKLYYFILAYTQPCPVVVVRSPQGTEKMKRFLGYEWSAARGQEGIKYLRGSIECIETPLFDPQDRDHPEKISTLIRKNFEGQRVSIPTSLQSYATVARLVDLLDFSRVSFDKQISLAPKKDVKEISITAIQNFAVPVPPTDVQAQIVAECQAIDAEVEQKEKEIQGHAQTFTSLFQKISNFVTLDSVVSLVKDRVNPATQQGKAFYIGLENIESGTGELIGETEIDYSAIKSVKMVFKRGDILYGKLRPNLNKVYLARQDGICSTDILVLRPKNERIGVYLSCYLLTEEFNQKVVQTIRGQQLPRTSWEEIRVLLVRFPSDGELENVIEDISKIQAQLQSAREVIASASANRQEVLQKYLGSA